MSGALLGMIVLVTVLAAFGLLVMAGGANLRDEDGEE